jgi:hypothetical protein
MGGVARVIGGAKKQVAEQAVEARKESPMATEPAGRSEMAERTAASLRARRRGSNRNLLGGEDQQSTLG